MRVLVVTTLSHLDANRLMTSSEKYDFQFCNALRRHTDLEVVTISKTAVWNSPIDAGVLGMRDRRSLLGFHDVFSELQASSHDVVIFWGYDSRLMGHLLACRHRHGFRLVDFLYDHFAPSVEQMPNPKRLAARAYFAIAEGLLPRLDGLILFNTAAIKHTRFTGPYLSLHPCFSEHPPQAARVGCSHGDKYILTYTGTLAEYNSVRELLQAFHGLTEENFELRIFGAGPLETLVREYCETDCRIHFGGLISGDELIKEQRRADLLLNLRSREGIINDFSFPSKLLEYITIGVPVLSTDLGEIIDPFRDCLNVIPVNSVEAIRSGIREAYNTSQNEFRKQERCRQNLAGDQRFQWQHNAQLVASFLEALVQ